MSNIILLMLDNRGDNEKKISLEIECHGYVSLNGYSYKTVMKPRESKYLFALAQDRMEVSMNASHKSTDFFKFHITCE